MTTAIPQKKLLGAGLIAVALFLFWLFPYPAYQKIAAYRSAIGEREQLLVERRAAMDQITKLKKEYDQRASQIQRFSAVIPSKMATAELISALEQIANQSGVQMGDVTFSDSKQQTQTDYQLLGVGINGKGTYSGLVTFLESIERSIRLLDVSKVDAGTDTSQGSLLNFTIQADAYFLK
ncbi:MAG: type 4a pilus biogenesis protein PilO [Candidatus Yanofskybacteria bacterium]|nr:type 4a pilus biogenesis protein PilO [Candidatus Yanofskybacteria bacterium]